MLVEDVIESIRKIFAYTENLSYEDFLNDSKTIDAVVRNFEIIGEAANRLPDNFKQTHPSVDWQRLRGFRNRIVHEYFGIDYAIVWEIKQRYLPTIIAALESI